MRKIKTDEIVKTLVPSLYSKDSKKIYFKHSVAKFNRLKETLAKELKLNGDYNFASINFPINELISILYQKEFWTKDEIKLLDDQFTDYSLRYLVKRVSELL